MKRLAPDLFDRRFQDFVETGRARLRPLAPNWTDHNAHDPGITLVELLAWTAEAQLYSLARMRRDERAAYASLLGVEPRGTQPASGLIWPDPRDPASPARTYTNTMVLPQGTIVNLAEPGPVYRTLQDLLWAPGTIQSLTTNDGLSVTDHTTKNQRGQVVYFPFGQDTGLGQVLSLSFRCRDEAGLFGTTRRGNPTALWPIGVLAAPGLGSAASSQSVATPGSPLSASLISGGERIAASIVSDTSQGMLTTGVLLLDLRGLPDSPSAFTLELRAPKGLVRPARVLRIEPNVIPFEQGQNIEGAKAELHVASGLPGWSFTLGMPGLRFMAGAQPVQIEVPEPAGVSTWWRCDDLSELGPSDKAYSFDAAAGVATFGNGINGNIPAAGSQVQVTYQICDGEAGNVARNRRWTVAGFQGVFGINPSPVSGGSPAPDGNAMRRNSRRRLQEEFPLVTSEDIKFAAMSLPILEVGRTWMLTPSSKAFRTGVTTLVAVRIRPGGIEPAQPPETPLWLRAIQQSLAPRLPLGTRLSVIGPQYVGFSIAATLESVPGQDPKAVQTRVKIALRKRFELVPLAPNASAPNPGVPVSPRDVAAAIRAVDGVSRIVALHLADATGEGVDPQAVPGNALAKFDFEASRIDVSRPRSGGGAA